MQEFPIVGGHHSRSSQGSVLGILVVSLTTGLDARMMWLTQLVNQIEQWSPAWGVM